MNNKIGGGRNMKDDVIDQLPHGDYFSSIFHYDNGRSNINRSAVSLNLNKNSVELKKKKEKKSLTQIIEDLNVNKNKVPMDKCLDDDVKEDEDKPKTKKKIRRFNKSHIKEEDLHVNKDKENGKQRKEDNKERIETKDSFNEKEPRSKKTKYKYIRFDYNPDIDNDVNHPNLNKDNENLKRPIIKPINKNEEDNTPIIKSRNKSNIKQKSRNKSVINVLNKDINNYKSDTYHLNQKQREALLLLENKNTNLRFRLQKEKNIIDYRKVIYREIHDIEAKQNALFEDIMQLLPLLNGYSTFEEEQRHQLKYEYQRKSKSNSIRDSITIANKMNSIENKQNEELSYLIRTFQHLMKENSNIDYNQYK